jgi:hypothetical protein
LPMSRGALPAPWERTLAAFQLDGAKSSCAPRLANGRTEMQSRGDLYFSESTIRRSMRVMPLCLFITLILTVVCPPVNGAAIPSGYDFFLTSTTTIPPTNVDLTGFGGLGLGLIPLKGLPATQANPNPNPFFPLVPPPFQDVIRIDWVDQHGNQVGPHDVHAVSTRVTVVMPFDVVVQRMTSASITGAGATADVSIQMYWLSLMSISPVTTAAIPGCAVAPGCDIYVGVDSAPQTPGTMRLTSQTADGSFGTASIGRLGVTSDDPAAPGFLGLPLLYDVVFAPAGTTVQAARQNGLTSIFHGLNSDPSGTYGVVPEPSSLWLILIGSLVFLGFYIKRRPAKSSNSI